MSHSFIAVSQPASIRPSATSMYCQKSVYVRATATRPASAANCGKPRRLVVETYASSSRETLETWIGAPSRNAPPPRSAHQRWPSAGADDDADDDLAVALERDQRRPDRQPARVLLRAVDRVEPPADVSLLDAELLACDRLAAVARDARAQRLLDRAVRLRHRRQVRLRLDAEVERAVVPHREDVRLVGERERVLEVGRCGHPPDSIRARGSSPRSRRPARGR